jgi:hypothetical protein
LATGNGSVPSTPEPGTATTVRNFGESVVELKPSSTGQLQVVDFFIPYDATTLNSEDGDLGSGGPVQLPASMGTPQEPNVLVEVGKEGILYALNMNALGGYKHGPSNSDAVPWEGGSFNGVWSKPAVWPGDGGYIYYPTAGTTPVKTNGGSLDVFQRMVSASGAVYFQLVGATANTANTFGYSSSSPVITSNGTRSGSAVLWIIHANNSSGSGAQLQAYDPIPQNPGASGSLNEIWHSATFTSTVFAPPAVDDGTIYVGTRTGNLLGYGLQSTATPAMNGDNVDFSPEIVSQPTTQTATFTASTALSVSSFSVNGPFSIQNSTPATPVNLTAGQSITVPVTFTPTTIGANTGTLTANVIAANTPSIATATLEGDGLGATQVMSAVPEEVDFTPQPINGTPQNQPVTFTNNSASAVTISSFTAPAQPFTVTNSPAANTVVQPGGTVNFTVTFTPPGSSGDFVHVFGGVATLVTSNGNFGVPVSGSAVPPSQINITPYSLNFGDVTVGTSSTLNFAIGDEGGEPLTITQSTPPSTGGFSATTTLTLGTVIPGNSSIEETVRFSPTSSGPLTSDWTITGDDGSGLQTVTFAGTGVPASSGGGGGGGGGPTTTTTTPNTTTNTTTTTTTTIPTSPPTITITSLSGIAGAPLTLTISGDENGGALAFKVRNGTATGCTIVHGTLITRSIGTCIVIAIRAATAAVPSISSSETTVALGRKYHISATHPLSITVNFSPSSTALSASAKISLQILAADLVLHNSVAVVGYASNDSSLAAKRAFKVAKFLTGLGVASITQRNATSGGNNKAIVNAR